MGTVTSNLALYSALVGAFLPLAISAIQQWHWPTHVRSLVAFAACVAAALGTSWLEGDLTARGLTAAILITLTTARSSYAALWKPTGLLDQVEAKTSGTTVQQVKQAQLEGQLGTLSSIPIVGQAVASSNAGQQTQVALRSSLDLAPLEEARGPLPDAAFFEVARPFVGDAPEQIPADQDPLVAVSSAG